MVLLSFVRAVVGAPGFVWHAASHLFGPRQVVVTRSLWLFFLPLLVINARLLWLNRAQLRSVSRLLLQRLRRRGFIRRLTLWASRTRGAPLSGRRPWPQRLSDGVFELAGALGSAAVDACEWAAAQTSAPPASSARSGAHAWASPARTEDKGAGSASEASSAEASLLKPRLQTAKARDDDPRSESPDVARVFAVPS